MKRQTGAAAFVAILLISNIPLHAVGNSPPPPCSHSEAHKTIAGNVSTFADPGSPWKVTTNLDAQVQIENTSNQTKCSTNIESVISVYIGKGNDLYFRSTEVSNDQLFVKDGPTCKDSKKAPIKLDGTSEAKVRRKLRSLGICTTTTPMDFPGFWQQFREAVINDDQKTVLAMTHFPFEEISTLPERKLRWVDSKAFLKLWKTLLNQDSGAGGGLTMRAYIKKRDGAVTGDLTEDGTRARMGAFEFRKTEEGWRWTGYYAAELFSSPKPSPTAALSLAISIFFIS